MGSANLALIFELLDQINKLLRPFLHDFTDGPRFVDQRFLLQITDGIAGSQHSLSFKGLIHARKDLQQRRCARSVQAEDTDLRAVEIGKGNIFQHFTLPMTLGHADHGINNLIGFVARKSSLQKNGPSRSGLQRQSLNELMICYNNHRCPIVFCPILLHYATIGEDSVCAFLCFPTVCARG